MERFIYNRKNIREPLHSHSKLSVRAVIQDRWVKPPCRSRPEGCQRRTPVRRALTSRRVRKGGIGRRSLPLLERGPKTALLIPGCELLTAAQPPAGTPARNFCHGCGPVLRVNGAFRPVLSRSTALSQSRAAERRRGERFGPD